MALLSPLSPLEEYSRRVNTMFFLPSSKPIQFTISLVSLNTQYSFTWMGKLRLIMGSKASKILLIGLLMNPHQCWSVWENQFQVPSCQGQLEREYHCWLFWTNIRESSQPLCFPSWSNIATSKLNSSADMYTRMNPTMIIYSNGVETLTKSQIG